MMRSTSLALLAISLSAAPALAQSAGGVPGFADLERSFAQDPSLGRSRLALASAIPVGTPVADATARLVDAGAGCRPTRKAPAVTKCLIHQYSLADGAADDIRWTVALQAPDGRLSALSVNRSVDRHGTN